MQKMPPMIKIQTEMVKLHVLKYKCCTGGGSSTLIPRLFTKRFLNGGNYDHQMAIKIFFLSKLCTVSYYVDTFYLCLH